MNQHKAKALRRAAQKAADQFPDVHSTDTWKNIVREWTEERTVKIPPSVLDRFRNLFRKKGIQPKTKTVEVVTRQSNQLVLTAGPKFIRRRLKAAIRRGEATISPLGLLQEVGTPDFSIPGTPYRHMWRRFWQGKS